MKDMTDAAALSFDDVIAAHERIKPYIHRTPVLTSSYLNELTGAELFFKCENLQKVGAFKARGAMATLTAAMTQQGLILGTAAYMSPEQARGKALDKRTDIWAFGVILWEMLTGERAFTGETTADTLTAILTKDPEEMSRPGRVVPPGARILARRSEDRLLSHPARARPR